MSNSEQVAFQKMLRESEERMFGDNVQANTTVKQNAIDALELLKGQYLAEWEVGNASTIAEIILQIEDID